MEKTVIGNFEVSEYNGSYSLIAVREYQGKHYQQWCRIELGKDKALSEKSQPVRVLLGDKEAAKMALLATLTAITGEKYVPFDDVPAF